MTTAVREVDAFVTLATHASALGLAPIDVRFAELISRLAEREHAGVLAATAALVSRERAAGHPCISLSAWAGRPLADGQEAPAYLRLPSADRWRAALDASTLAGAGDPPTPLVVEGDRCYLFRYWAAERMVAAALRDRVERGSIPTPAADAAAAFRRLFTPSGDGEIDLQAVVAAATLDGRLTLMTGGPGTGKTTTVARVLALLLTLRPDTRVALAAPTGKAAARLEESIAEQRRSLRVDEDVRARIPGTASTLHRLLGYHPARGTYRYDGEHPLACDVLVVDEASMVDLLMMEALLAAVPRDARLILVGDQDQLASVDAGFVFGDLCDAASDPEAVSPAFAAYYRELAGVDLPRAEHATRLSDSLVELRKSFRFGGRPGIADLAGAIRDGDAARALAVLDDSEMGSVRRVDPPADPADVVAALVADAALLAEEDDPASALAALSRFRVLAATHRGACGVEILNRVVERKLAELGHPVSEPWYHGRPVMVTANDYSVGLFNGDVGVSFHRKGQRAEVWFAGSEGRPRAVLPARLPRHETAWAMTVHKSQGSEFGRIVVVLPRLDSPLLTRELLYTAVTRARDSVLIVGGAEAVRRAVEHRAERVSGLRDRLRSDVAPA